MIDQVCLANFKCFEALELDFAPLTLLTGFNAGGQVDDDTVAAPAGSNA